MTEQKTDKPKETIPFYPDHIKTEAWVALGFFLVLVVIGMLRTAFNPVGLGRPRRPDGHAQPTSNRNGISSPLYQLLEICSQTAGVIIPIVGVIILLIWPFLDRKPNNKKQIRARWIYSALFS